MDEPSAQQPKSSSRMVSGESERRPRVGAPPPRLDPRSTVRRIALEILLTAPDAGRFVDEALAGRIEELQGRDRHLLQEIVYGTVRHRNTLDHLLDFYLRVPVSRQRPGPRWGLRLGAYQLVYLERIPPHAAVNQTLQGMKALGSVSQSEVGFTNAVLHKIAEDVRRKSAAGPAERDDPNSIPTRGGWAHFDRPVLPIHRLDPVGHLSIKHSHPKWLIERWIARYGEEEARKLLEAQNRTPAVTARVTSLAPSIEATIESLAAERTPAQRGSLAGSISLQKGSDPGASETLRRGWIQIQDETSMQIGAALAPPAGARALVLCAAPGSKALQVLERVGPTGHLVAVDRSEERLALLRQNLGRLSGNFSTMLLPEDLDQMQLGESFTHILIDAPCSNTGVLARRPEARWRIRSDDLKPLAELQSKLLEAAIRHLAAGGRVVYSTCSIEPEENEEIIAGAIGRHADLIERETRLFLPHRVGADGGFYSLVLRGRG